MRRTAAALFALMALAGALAAPRASAQQPRTLTADEITKIVDWGLGSEDTLDAERAADALCNAGTAALPKLIGALVREPPIRKRRAAALLGRMGDPAAIEPLAAILGDTRGDEGVKLAVATALLELGSREGVKALIDLLESAAARTRLDAFLVLRRYTHHAFNFEYDGPASSRQTSIGEWRGWWSKARADFALVEPTSPPRRLPPAGPLAAPVPPMPTATARPAPTTTAGPAPVPVPRPVSPTARP